MDEQGPTGPAPAARHGSPLPTTVRHRRPSGERPPLPRALYRDDLILLAAGVVVIATWLLAFWVLGPESRLERTDRALFDALVNLRTDATVDLARLLAGLVDATFLSWAGFVIGVGLVVLRRFRRLFVLLGTVAVATTVVAVLAGWLEEPRPYDVQILGDWAGYANPSLGLTALTALVLGVCFTYVPDGRARRFAAVVAAVVIALVVAAEVLLGVVLPSSAVMGVAIAGVTVVLGFRLLCPDAVFPVRYGSGRSAHLDLAGPRGDAIREAVAEQLGFEVTDVKPFGLAGSAGSTPMRLTVAGDPPHRLFAKLYAEQHVRSDRWYKLGRALLYGRLEDEAPFRSVRRLVQYEDYLMRVFGAAGVPVVETFGFVELTPEREYLLVTEFATGASELGDPEVVVDDRVIDRALGAIRALWDAGLAHRDVKPANLLIRGDEVVLIDVAFGQIRPTPWRQAVDLANMMLCLALRTDARRVYERALAWFSPEEIAEAFAAAHGVAVPTELRSRLKADGRDLRAQFRSMAPPYPTIPIQRWSLRRAGLIAWVLLLSLLTVLFFLALITREPGRAVAAPECPDSPSVLLFGQAVAASQLVPCLESVPVEWELGESDVDQGAGRIIVGLPGDEKVVVRFQDACPETSPAADGTEVPLRAPPNGEVWGVASAPGAPLTMMAADLGGGCVVVSIPADLRQRGGDERLATALGFVSRQDLDAAVAARTNGEFDRLTVP